MNIQLALISLAQVARGDLTMPRILFWILLILWGVGAFGWPENPNVARGTRIVLVILFAILGYYLFGF